VLDVRPHDTSGSSEDVFVRDLRSGSSIKVETRSQRGNHALKSALFLSAFASLHDPTCRDYNDRKRAQGKRHNAALICLARRRVDVIFAMLRDRKPYQQPASRESTSARGGIARQALRYSSSTARPRRDNSWV